MGRLDPELVAVLGHRPPGDAQVLAGQELADLDVAQRIVPVLGLDELADLVLDPERGDVLAVVPLQGLVEEVLQGEDAPRRHHVLVGHDPADRRLVDADVLGDLHQRQGLDVSRCPSRRSSFCRSTMNRATL